MFAFVSGVIQPLHMVADKCCDNSICVEAIELLEERPWREGAWDSAVMAKIARRKLQQGKEDHSPLTESEVGCQEGQSVLIQNAI